MDSPSRELDRILEEAQQDMRRLEREQREHEDFLVSVGDGMTSPGRGEGGARGDEDSAYVSGKDLHAQMARLRRKTAAGAGGAAAPFRARLGVGSAILHGQVKAGRNLRVARGTCDPFVKVSYVPPSEDGTTTSLSLRAKQKVHATEVLYDTASPLWAENMFRLDVEAPLSMHADDQDGEGSDWDKLRGDLLFAVYDNNDGLRNEFIGQVVFPLRSLVDGLSVTEVHGEGQTLHDVWCPLVGRRGGNARGDNPAIAGVASADPDDPALHLVMQLILPAEQDGQGPGGQRDQGSSAAPTPSKALAPGAHINPDLVIGDSLADRIALSAERGVDFYSPRDGEDEDSDGGGDSNINSSRPHEYDRLQRDGTTSARKDEKGSNKEKKATKLKAGAKSGKRRKKGGIKVKRPKFRSRFETANRIEQARIAKENLIFQRHLQKTRKGAGAGYGKAVGKSAAQKFQEQSSRATRERMKKELKRMNEHHNARIARTRGEIKPKPKPLPAWEQENLDREERIAELAREKRANQERYRREADANMELEQLRGDASKLIEEISVLQTKAQRYETMARRNQKLIDEAKGSAALREAAMQKGPRKKRESALPEGAKSLSALVPGSTQSEFTKMFGRGTDRTGKAATSGSRRLRASSKFGDSDSDSDGEGKGLDPEDEDRLAEVRGELAERLVTYEAAERRRTKHLERARAAQKAALAQEARLEEMRSQLEKVRARREWRAREALRVADGDVVEGKSGRGSTAIVGLDSEHSQIMAEKAKLNAAMVDVETLKFEVDDLRRDHTYELEALSSEKSSLESRIARKQEKLDAEIAKRDSMQQRLNLNLKSGKIEELTVMIRNMRNAELLCRHARDNRAAFEDDAMKAVRRAKKKFDSELEQADALTAIRGM